MSYRKGFGVEVDMEKLGVSGLLGFIFGVGIPLALSAYVFFGQIITMDVVNDLKDSRDYQSENKQKELTEIYASNIIVLVLTGGVLLAGAYILAAGIVSMTSGSLSMTVK